MSRDLQRVSEVKLVYKTRIKAADRIKINNEDDAFRVFWNHWDKESIEHIESVKLMLLNRSNRVLGLVTVSQGGTVGTVIDIKVILQYALKSNASGIILAHNHPSGIMSPSEADKKITEKLKKACAVMDIQLLDHLIICPDERFNSICT